MINDRIDMVPAGYEAPCIEQVLSADDVEREVHYAGGASPPIP